MSRIKKLVAGCIATLVAASIAIAAVRYELVSMDRAHSVAGHAAERVSAAIEIAWAYLISVPHAAGAVLAEHGLALGMMAMGIAAAAHAIPYVLVLLRGRRLPGLHKVALAALLIAAGLHIFEGGLEFGLWSPGSGLPEA